MTDRLPDPEEIKTLLERVVAQLHKEGVQSLPQKEFVVNINVITVNMTNDRKTIIKAGGDVNAPVTVGDHNVVTSTTNQIGIQKELDTLTGLVDALAKKLPPDKAKELREHFEGFKEQATSEKPRKAWYEVSAAGILEAAKTVAEMTPSITKSVRAILNLLAGAAP